MTADQYDYFKKLRQDYYLAGRCLLINQMFAAAGINFGYAIELTLKFILAFNGIPKKELMNHHIKNYYAKVIECGYIEPVNVSDDFLSFADDRLNARYPSYLSNQFTDHQAKEQAYAFTIDMLHCYDDFILQLDDAVTQAVGDARISVGFRSCRELLSTDGRIFFHSNDHAFERIPKYRELLRTHRDDGDNFEDIDGVLGNPANLWNFKGLIAYRPWGPKAGWSPAQMYSAPKTEGNLTAIRAALWATNEGASDISISSAALTLSKGKYEYATSKVRIAPETKPTDG